MTAYAVDAELISVASAQACTTASTIRTEVDTLMAQLLALQDSWTGGAQVNFQATITQWQGIQAQTHEALDTISAQLQTAAATYSEAEAHSASLFAGAA
ncbi:type VII secretion protein [Schaalia meyeri]|uniref:ESAT-6-like protein n=1 Tax=Schaalia meyeri TaxID=52773 RepID=A0AAP9Y7Q9_9ACTO|nr:WXG100 family type VII secretion target [Schaalia meyeri]AKU64381.1 type VII secretion protein [Schaalia meyeri]OFQ25115.1 type VII secretion protein [Actinomyces sp. HMSC062G12]QQC43415.1 WXG100 family type VII secretion target [Schaalia meyeri]SDR90800.1 WXG100 family type VII secretion target [Schaalia meyeri]